MRAHSREQLRARTHRYNYTVTLVGSAGLHAVAGGSDAAGRAPAGAPGQAGMPVVLLASTQQRHSRAGYSNSSAAAAAAAAEAASAAAAAAAAGGGATADGAGYACTTGLWGADGLVWVLLNRPEQVPPSQQRGRASRPTSPPPTPTPRLPPPVAGGTGLAGERGCARPARRQAGPIAYAPTA
jgi:hypothetical protein